MQNLKNRFVYCLKNESYEVYEKMDGSLGILYLDPADNMFKIATRGSFHSDQAKKGTELWHTKFYPGISGQDDISSDGFYNGLLKTNPELKDYTLLFEIIYPENRVNDGARLVCDYGSNEMLVLLGGVNKFTGKDLEYKDLENISDQLGLQLARKFNYKIEDLIEMKKTLPKTEEGWVIRFQSGFRVKIKGDEYCRFQKIINGITPLNIWDIMLNNEKFELGDDYKKEIPEEILKEAEEIEQKLFLRYSSSLTKALEEYNSALDYAKMYHSDKIERGLGLYIKENNDKLKHPNSIFLIHKNDLNSLKKSIIMSIRPTGNKL